MINSCTAFFKRDGQCICHAQYTKIKETCSFSTIHGLKQWHTTAGGEEICRFMSPKPYLWQPFRREGRRSSYIAGKPTIRLPPEYFSCEAKGLGSHVQFKIGLWGCVVWWKSRLTYPIHWASCTTQMVILGIFNIVFNIMQSCTITTNFLLSKRGYQFLEFGSKFFNFLLHVTILCTIVNRMNSHSSKRHMWVAGDISKCWMSRNASKILCTIRIFEKCTVIYMDVSLGIYFWCAGGEATKFVPSTHTAFKQTGTFHSPPDQLRWGGAAAFLPLFEVRPITTK